MKREVRFDRSELSIKGVSVSGCECVYVSGGGDNSIYGGKLVLLIGVTTGLPFKSF